MSMDLTGDTKDDKKSTNNASETMGASLDLQQSITGLTAQITKLEEELAEFKAERSALKTQLKLEPKREDLKAEIKDADTNINTLLNTIAAKENLRAELEKQKGASQAEMGKGLHVALDAAGPSHKRKAESDPERADSQAKKFKAFMEAKPEEKSDDIKFEYDDGDEEVITFHTVTLDDGWLLPRAPKTIMVRPCFGTLRGLTAQAVQKGQPVLLVGSPGTGKSQYAMWLAHQLYKNVDVPMVIDILDGYFMLVRPDGSTECGVRGNSFHEELSKPETLYIFDARDQSPAPLPVHALLLASTSPSRKEMQKWKQKNNPAQLVMPLWSEEELLACRKLCFKEIKEDDFFFLYAHWGGIVRHTLTDLAYGFTERDKSDVREHWNKTAKAILGIGELGKQEKLKTAREFSLALLRSKIGSNTFEHLTSFVGQDDCMSDKGDRILHSLLHIVTTDCQNFTMEFASQYVTDQLLHQDGKFSEAKCEHFLASHPHAFFAGVRGQVYEAYAHRRLCRERKDDFLICSEMFENKTDTASVNVPFPRTPVYHQFIKAKELQPGEYGVPFARNYPAVDSLIRPSPSNANMPAVCFQMSVKNEEKSGRHGYWQHALVALRKELKLTNQQPIYCILVAPPDTFDTVAFQPLWVKGKKSGGKQQVEKLAKGLQTMRQFKLCLGWTGK